MFFVSPIEFLEKPILTHTQIQALAEPTKNHGMYYMSNKCRLIMVDFPLCPQKTCPKSMNKCVCVCRFGLVVLNPSDGKYRSSLSSFDHNWSQIPLKNIEKPSLGYGFKMTGMFWHQQRNRSQLVLQVWKHPLKSPSNLIGSVQKH